MKHYHPSEILPHKDPLILVDDYLDYGDDFIRSTVQIKDESLFCENGYVPSYVCLEYIAQTIGMWRGLNDKINDQNPKIGYLVSARKVNLMKSNFSTGDTLHIFAKLKSMIDSMASFECIVKINDSDVATCLLNVYQSDN